MLSMTVLIHMWSIQTHIKSNSNSKNDVEEIFLEKKSWIFFCFSFRMISSSWIDWYACLITRLGCSYTCLPSLLDTFFFVSDGRIKNSKKKKSKKTIAWYSWCSIIGRNMILNVWWWLKDYYDYYLDSLFSVQSQTGRLKIHSEPMLGGRPLPKDDIYGSQESILTPFYFDDKLNELFWIKKIKTYLFTYGSNSYWSYFCWQAHAALVKNCAVKLNLDSRVELPKNSITVLLPLAWTIFIILLNNN